MPTPESNLQHESAQEHTDTLTSVTPDPTNRVFHTLLVFRCPVTLAESLAALAARRGSSNVSAVIRELLEAGLKDQHVAG